MVVSVQGLSKVFGERYVLSDVSFELADGEILGVIGPSGGGKSTLLRCLDLLERSDAGVITYEHSDRAEITSGGQYDEDALCKVRQGIGFVFQGFNLWEEKSVIQNLVLSPMVVLGRSRHAAEEQAEALCARFGLRDKLNARVWALSTGQKQRVALIRALLLRPKLLLLDEITSALDPVLTVEVMDCIQELRHEGLAMIIVTHHIEFAASICDRLIFLSSGKIVQIDAPAALLAHPAASEISQFLTVLRRAR